MVLSVPKQLYDGKETRHEQGVGVHGLFQAHTPICPIVTVAASRQVGPVGEWVTLPEYFKHNGYLTLGLSLTVTRTQTGILVLPLTLTLRLPTMRPILGSGKLFHPVEPGKENLGMDNNDYPASWSEEPNIHPKHDHRPDFDHGLFRSVCMCQCEPTSLRRDHPCPY